MLAAFDEFCVTRKVLVALFVCCKLLVEWFWVGSLLAAHTL